MTGRSLAFYYAWNRVDECDAPLSVIENQFPALFEARRMLYPRLEELADPLRFDQGIAGVIDHSVKKNFVAFIEQASAESGHCVLEIERGGHDGRQIGLDSGLLETIDTLIIIGFDSMRTAQRASDAEVATVRSFLDRPD